MRLHSRGEVTEEDIRPFLDRFTVPPFRSDVLEMIEEGFDGYTGDVALHEGDLSLEALNTEKSGIMLLVVDGDLSVEGPYLNACNDGPDFLLVTGTLRADAVFTAGNVEIHGDLIATRAVVGDWYMGGALIHGALQTPLLVGLDYGFTVNGDVDVENLLGIDERLVGSPRPRNVCPPDDLERFFESDFLQDGGHVPCRLMYSALIQGTPVFK